MISGQLGKGMSRLSPEKWPNLMRKRYAISEYPLTPWTDEIRKNKMNVKVLPARLITHSSTKSESMDTVQARSRSSRTVNDHVCIRRRRFQRERRKNQKGYLNTRERSGCIHILPDADLDFTIGLSSSLSTPSRGRWVVC